MEKQITKEAKNEMPMVNEDEMRNYRNNINYVYFKSIADKYDNENYILIENNISQGIEEIHDTIAKNEMFTPKEKRNGYSKLIIDQIKSMKKTNQAISLPKLPYGKQLSDIQFLEVFTDCIKYANSNLNKNKIENIKTKLLDSKYLLETLFDYPQITKDLKENVLLTILVSNNEEDQEDNFSILKTQYTTTTPLINLKFKNHEVNKTELIEIFSSPVYIQNYHKTMKNFLPNYNLSDEQLQDYIQKYFANHDIYFADFPENILAITIHNGNIYLKGKYLVEYYTEKSTESQLIIREKIILNIGHELNHVIQREIDENMRSNFLIKSDNKKKTKPNEKIVFVSKFDSSNYLLNIDESGNAFDYFFFNKYYFDDLYNKEAELFLNIKDINSISEYNSKLENIIKNEKISMPKITSINKFKRIELEPARCIKSRFYGKILISNDDELKLDKKSGDDIKNEN